MQKSKLQRISLTSYLRSDETLYIIFYPTKTVLYYTDNSLLSNSQNIFFNFNVFIRNCEMFHAIQLTVVKIF